MRRTLVLFLVSIMAFSGSLVAGVGTVIERDADLRGYVNPAEDAGIPYYIPRLGVNADLTQYSETELRRQLDLMRRAGISWVRQRFNWKQLGTPEHETAPYDELFRALAEERGPRLIAVLTDPAGVPPDPAQFSEAAGMFAAAYGEQIAAYEVWDEPNLGAMWGGQPNPTAYAALLSAAYDAIHERDSDALVNAGALAPTLELGPANLSDLRFLDALYRLGVEEYSDGISAKPYGFNRNPDDRAAAEVLNFNRIVLLRDIMSSYGDLTTPLWASEWGWNALPEDWQGAPSIWGSVTVDQQIDYTLQTLSRVQARYPWLSALLLSDWQPSLEAGDPRWGFALRQPSGDGARLYDVLARSVASLSGAPIGLHRPDSIHARYTGVWTFGELGADIGWVGDSSVDFAFEGDAISALVREGDYTAYLYASIDGQPANRLPTDADGSAYLLLTSDTRTPEIRLVPIASELGAGVHTLRLIAERGWDQWALVGFAVGGADLTFPYDRQIALAGLSLVLSSAAVFIFGRQLPISHVLRQLHRILAHLGRIGTLVVAFVAAFLMMTGMLLTWRDVVPDILRREPVQLSIALLTGGLLYLNPALVISILAAFVLFVIFFHKPLYGLTLTLFFAPFYLFPVELFHFAFPMSEMLVLIAFAAWVLRSGVIWAQRRSTGLAALPPLRWHILDILMLIYLAIGFVSLAWTEYRSFAMTELRTLFVEPLLFYLILRTSRPSQIDWLRLIDALVLSAVFVALIGLFLYVRGDAIITAEEGAQRLASVYGSPNNVALWLGRAFPFALAFALSSVDRRRRVLMGLACLLIIVTIGFTLSAGAIFLGIPAATVVVLILVYRKRSIRPLLALGALVAAGFPILAQFPRFARLLEPGDGTNFFRIRVWQSALAMIRDHPVTGIGQDQFLAYFQGRYILPDAWQEPGLSHPHNFILDIWLRLGLAGFLWVGVLLAAMVRALWGSYARLRTVPEQRMATTLCVGGLGALANLFGHGMIDNSLFVNDQIYVFVLLVGFAVWSQQTR